MFKDIRENIYVSLESSKLRIGIIGGGKAALIKSKTFIKKGCLVEILSKEFDKELLNINNSKLRLISSKYSKEFILDKHIIILALDNKDLLEEIRKDCEDNCKIYIDSTDFKKGMGVVPVQRETKNFDIAVSTKLGNPKVSMLVAEKATNVIKEYDNFIELSTKIRNNAKAFEALKITIINFVSTDDFKFIFEKDKDREVMTMFFKEDIVNSLYRE